MLPQTPVIDQIRRAKEIRERLRHPPNAVVDIGIDLRRPKRIPPKKVISEPPKVEEPAVIEYSLPPPISENEVRFEAVARAVCDLFNVTMPDLRGRCRQQWIVIPRHIAIYLALKYCRGGYRSLNSIGRLFNRDHSTVLHAKRQIEKFLLLDERVQEMVAKLERDLFHGHHHSGRSAPTYLGEPHLARRPGAGVSEPSLCGLDERRTESVDNSAVITAQDDSGTLQGDDFLEISG